MLGNIQMIKLVNYFEIIQITLCTLFGDMTFCIFATHLNKKDTPERAL